MFRTIDIILVSLVLLVATGTYVIKYGSVIEHNNVAKLEREIQAKRDSIDILNANWSLLTNPARIQKLAERHGEELKLEVLNSKQIISINDIPMRKTGDAEILNAENSGQVDRNPEVITGAVKKEGAGQ